MKNFLAVDTSCNYLTVIAAKNGEKIGIVNEAADLLYHVMVLLNATDVKLSDVCVELCKRNR